MNELISINNLAHIIQLAVAPVFLLAGIAGFLNVMSMRLGRIIDRSRVINDFITYNNTTEKSAGLFNRELKLLRKRTTVTQRSIALCTGSALMVCVLIVSLFIGDALKLNLGVFIISCFVLAMLLLIAALMLFLLEIKLATRQLELL